MNKYTLTSNTKVVNNVTLYQIQALRDFSDVTAGDLGGYIESESNLDQRGDCWVHGDACVYGDARVYDNARVYGEACVSDNAHVSGNAHVYGNACVYGDALVYGEACVYVNAHVYDNARVYGDASVSGNAHVYGNARVYGDASVSDNAHVSGNAHVYGNARVFDEMHIVFGSCTVDLTNKHDSIRCQTGLAVANNNVLCYKRVRSDLSSFFDVGFKYVLGEVVEAEKPEISNESCASGLHFSYATYWDSRIDLSTSVLLLCEVHIDDVITCQEGKIRAKKCKVLAICE